MTKKSLIESFSSLSAFLFLTIFCYSFFKRSKSSLIDPLGPLKTPGEKIVSPFTKLSKSKQASNKAWIYVSLHTSPHDKPLGCRMSKNTLIINSSIVLFLLLALNLALWVMIKPSRDEPVPLVFNDPCFSRLQELSEIGAIPSIAIDRSKSICHCVELSHPENSILEYSKIKLDDVKKCNQKITMPN